MKSSAKYRIHVVRAILPEGPFGGLTPRAEREKTSECLGLS